MAGYKTLEPGQSVMLEWEVAQQDGFSYRARRTWPAGERPVVDRAFEVNSSDGYRSTLTITYDDDPT